jgi:hypothetical protein
LLPEEPAAEEPAGCGCMAAALVLVSAVIGVIGGIAFGSVWIGLGAAALVALFYAALVAWAAMT